MDKESVSKEIEKYGWKCLNIEEYENSKTVLKLQCDKGHYQEKTAGAILTRRSCLECKKEYQQQRIKEAATILGIKILDQKYSQKDIVNCICSEGHKFKRRCSCFLEGLGCSVCGTLRGAEKNKGTIEKVEEICARCSDGVRLVEGQSYIGIHEKLKFTCENGHVFLKDANNLRKSLRCPECSREKGFRKPLDSKEYTDRLIKEVGEDYEVIEPMRRHDIPVVLKHKKCNKLWAARYSDIMSGNRCPCTVKRFVRSKAEEEIASYVEELGLEVKRNIILPGMNKFELDIYVPKENIAIEYNGLYWHSTEYKDKNYHRDKRRMAESLGIRLIQIWDDDYIKNKELILEKIRYILKKEDIKRVYARLCYIKNIDIKVYKEFMNRNHIQGADNPKYRLGLFKDDQLVAALGLSLPNISRYRFKKDNEFEISRYSTEQGYSIDGGFSKLIKFIKNNYEFEKLYSYADLDIVDKNNNIYLKTGFEEEHECDPHFYWNINNEKVGRFKFRKQLLYKKFKDVDMSKTEEQIMKEKGIYKVWNSGLIKYSYHK